MPATHYGPVSATQLARHAAKILRPVRKECQTVLVSVRAQVVAVILPLSSHRPIPQGPHPEVSVRDLERQGPASVIESARTGITTVLTYQNKPFALFTPVSQWAELNQILAQAPEPGDQVPGDATSTQRPSPTPGK